MATHISTEIEREGTPEGFPPAKTHLRLEFLYKVVEDTQNTIRFLDTKAAFCVTLLSGMAALALQRPPSHSLTERVVFRIFMACAATALLVCLRVIFPTVKPSGKLFGKTRRAPGQPLPPRFYVGHNKAHRWLLNTISSRTGDVLNETHDTYLAELSAATDEALLSSMCDEVLMVALIRQVKSDRLHAAMFCIVATVLAFAAFALT
jgi:hypothetical protein